MKSEDLFGISNVAVAGEVREDEVSYLLRNLEVFNWGPFIGKQRTAEIDAGGTAIIGATGSGKTTLIDALMTLLVAYPKYNLASTGGHESDRDLVSYVRGVAGTRDGHGEAANVMRPGRTVTGLAARYRSNQAAGGELLVGALLWFEGASSAAADLKKLWFVSEAEDVNLTDLLRLLDEGGKRKVKAYGAEVERLDVYDSKKGYLARLRRFFEVGENAFALLNRAAGLKQLNSIDQIFRELVLDNEPLFKDGLKVAADFDALAEIRQEVERAKRQRDSLLPIEREHKKWGKLREEIVELKELRKLVPLWFAMEEVRLLSDERKRLAERMGQLSGRQTEMNEQVKVVSDEAKQLQARYMEAGGGEMESLKRVLESHRGVLGERESEAARYAKWAAELGLGVVGSEDDFSENAQQAAVLRVSSEQQKEELHTLLIKIGAENLHLVERLNAVAEERAEVEKRPGSNIPAEFQRFREELADELGMDAGQLPFVAELVQVRPEERAWQGAIERALGPERLRVFVPDGRMRQALAWVNGRNNRLHVRLQRVEESYASLRFYDDSYVHKLELKEHGYKAALRDLLHQRDRHCVENVAELERVEHGMTREGTLSGRGGKFDKQDQRQLRDGWMTGFDNSHQLERLRAEEETIHAQLKSPLERQRETEKQQQAVDQCLRVLERLDDFKYSRIDVSSARERVERVTEQIRELESPDSDLSKTRVAYESKEIELENLRQEQQKVSAELGRCDADFMRVEEQLEEARDTMGAGLAADESTLLQQKLALTPLEKVRDVERLRRDTEAKILRDLEGLEAKEVDSRERLVRNMESARAEDSGALVETGTELSDIGDYLDRLEFLRKEDLPQRQQRFMEYLNKSSGQGVTQLLSRIDNEVAQIVDRISQLNETLGRVEFKPGLHLELVTQQVGSDTMKQLAREQKRLTFAMVSVNDDEGESHYQALKAVVDVVREAANNPTRRGSQSLLDPRHRLEFSVREVVQVTGEKSAKIFGSQTGSGGEKEMMASYILTASLSYALCPQGAARPRYATIVLDEAFSKSSQSAATRIIRALREFGLHPLFVTPNKEMSLLRAHTRSAILVHRATLHSLTWRELDELQQSQSQNREEGR